MPAMEFQNIFLALFVLVFLFRYTRTIASIFIYNLYWPKPLKAKPRSSADDVTVIVPTTFKTPDELTQCLSCILDCAPAAVYVVTSIPNVDLVKAICSLKGFAKVQVLGVEKLNKRRQMLKALEKVETPITVFADDDVSWPSSAYLSYLLAIFEDPDTGAGGTRQRTRRKPGFFTSPWNFLGICYLERRVWNNITTNAVDGSISTLSGRTSAYRTEILKTPDFFHYFQNDTWRGLPLNSDDDKCLTRYVYSHGWNITIQSDPRSVLETTLEEGPKYISQCLRWVRASRRGNRIVMENEAYWQSWKFWWGRYCIYGGAPIGQTPALLWDGALFALLASSVYGTQWSPTTYWCLAGWILFTKNLKMIPHYRRHPQDMIYIPLSVAFSYLHSLISLYASFSLSQTQWGSQNLQALETVRAKDGEVVPLLKSALTGGEEYPEAPEPGRLMVGDDYFSAVPAVPLIDVRA